jgi:arylsulfatase A-like enzyme
VKREICLSECGVDDGQGMRRGGDVPVAGRYSVSTFLGHGRNCENFLTALLRLGVIFLIALAAWAMMASAVGGEPARHVVVMVWDGMRPDFVSPARTPALYQLARQGVEFEDHHPSYLSLTEGNGTVMSTGVYPDRTGVLADTEYRPEINLMAAVHTEELDVVRKGDAVSRGRYVGAPTMVELLRKAGKKTVVAGSEGVVLLADRNETADGKAGVDLFAGRTLPTNVINTISVLGRAFPDVDTERPSRDDWTTEAVINPLWHNGVPDFTFLWLDEPDLAQLRTGPGSQNSLVAIHRADDNLARVLRALADKHALDTTDVLVVSDHGFSTILAMVDLAESLQHAGLNAWRGFSKKPAAGDVMVVSNGGSVLIYVIGHDAQVVKKVVGFLQGWRCSGVIFTKKPMPGTFTLAQVHEDAANSPDVVVSLRWSADKNDAGTPGMVYSDISRYGAGQGMHATLSPFDMHNMLIAAGPDFRSGIVDHLPTGNMDIAPTVLWLLGVKAPKGMNGRVLSEALTIDGPKIKSYEPGRLEANAPAGAGEWHQYLNYTQVNGVDYFDEGNGSQATKAEVAGGYLQAVAGLR